MAITIKRQLTSEEKDIIHATPWLHGNLIGQLKMAAPDGKRRLTNCLTPQRRNTVAEKRAIQKRMAKINATTTTNPAHA